MPSDSEPGVGAGQFASIRNLSDHFKLVDPAWLSETVKSRGFRMVHETTRPLASGKAFWMVMFARVA